VKLRMVIHICLYLYIGRYLYVLDVVNMDNILISQNEVHDFLTKSTSLPIIMVEVETN
jgi:hypothetical protein